MEVSILKLKDSLIVGIQSDLLDSDIAKLHKDVLERIRDLDIKNLIIDVSTLYMMDSFIARSIIRLIKAASYMGAQGIIAGISSEVALTLLRMGFDWGEIETALNLEQALEIITQRGKPL